VRRATVGRLARAVAHANVHPENYRSGIAAETASFGIPSASPHDDHNHVTPEPIPSDSQQISPQIS
jgi:hypothetical protein